MSITREVEDIAQSEVSITRELETIAQSEVSITREVEDIAQSEVSIARELEDIACEVGSSPPKGHDTRANALYFAFMHAFNHIAQTKLTI